MRLELREQLAHGHVISENDFRRARPARRLWPLRRFLESHSYPAAVKAACRLLGDTTGPVRAPLLPPDDDATAELAGLLERATVAEAAH